MVVGWNAAIFDMLTVKNAILEQGLKIILKKLHGVIDTLDNILETALQYMRISEEATELNGGYLKLLLSNKLSCSLVWRRRWKS